MIQEISLPVQIDGFTFHEIGFSIKGREYPYENIASLKFLIQNTTINFSTDETYILGLRTHSDEIISIHVSDAAFSFNKKKVAEKKKICLLLPITLTASRSSDASTHTWNKCKRPAAYSTRFRTKRCSAQNRT